MRTEEIVDTINRVLPDGRVGQDIFEYLEIEGWPTSVELDEKWVTIPEGTILEVTDKVLVTRRYALGFGPCYYVVQVAIGGVEEERHGILYARICFATLYYNEDRKVITVDFHKEMR